MPIAEAWEIVVEREPEYDDDDRHRLLGLARFRAGVCRGCGYHSSLTGDLSNVFSPEDEICPVCRGLDRWTRMRGHAEHAQYEKAPADAPRPDDGRTTFMKLVDHVDTDHAEGGD